jgi:subtilase family serine protease
VRNHPIAGHPVSLDGLREMFAWIETPGQQEAAKRRVLWREPARDCAQKTDRGAPTYTRKTPLNPISRSRSQILAWLPKRQEANMIIRITAAGIVLTGLLAACVPAQAGAASSGGPAKQSANPSPSSTADCNSPSLTTCYTPQQLQVAYGVKPLLDHGITGRGQTVVLPELAESQLNPPLVTDLRQDMAAFDSLFGLPAARMRVVTTLAGSRSPWLAFGEEVLDVEMVHALAPGATLVILLVPSTSLDNTSNAVSAAVASLRLGSTEGGVMSISAAGQVGGEHCVSRAQASSVNAALQRAARRHATVVAASGDIGAVAEPCDVYAALTGTGTFTPVKEVNLPASDPLVLSAGGTSLTASHTTGAWISETAWGLASGNPGNQGGSFQASGGGFSHLFARPAYQADVPDTGATRGVPDVSADASDRPGVAVVFSNGTQYIVQSHGGTSASAPMWAALIALADQYAGHRLGFVNPAIYRIARSPYYHRAFHDITQGNNTVQFPPETITGYRAAPGWDPVTGWGSPDAQVLIPLLARFAS